MDRTRKKLIEELMRVGHLIDPVPGNTERLEDKDTTEFAGIIEDSRMGSTALVPDLEDLPIVNDVVDQPYVTQDMFTRPEYSYGESTTKPAKAQQIEANKSDSRNIPANEREGLAATNPKKEIGHESGVVGFPLEELARELVTLIEDRVSQRSGEHLDDTFRDELTQAVTEQLEGWLKYS